MRLGGIAAGLGGHEPAALPVIRPRIAGVGETAHGLNFLVEILCGEILHQRAGPRRRALLRRGGGRDGKTGAAPAGRSGMVVNVHRVRIDWGDCDPARIVFYPNYFRWFDQATSRLFESVGLPWSVLFRSGDITGLPL